MSKSIHPTAVIEKGAEIGQDVTVGPYCIVGPRVTLGDKVILKSHVVIDGRTSIGEETVVHPFASLGGPPQDLKYRGEDSALVVGKNNVIREYVTMNAGTQDGGMETVVGDRCLFMTASHVAHDCRIGNNVILANGAAIGGHVRIGDYAIIGGLAAVHQHIRIGAHAIIGGVTGVDNDVIPYGRVKGGRAQLMGLNLIGLERRGFPKDQIRALQKAFNRLFADEGTMDERIESVAADFGADETVMTIIQFARQESKFPLCQPPRKNQ